MQFPRPCQSPGEQENGSRRKRQADLLDQERHKQDQGAVANQKLKGLVHEGSLPWRRNLK
jgi:hypothetical protein